jgi:hypothetical protein
MAHRDYESTPVSDALGLRGIVIGLSGDLESLRNGTISPQDAHARAAVAKQIFNGVRLYLQAIKTMEALARPVSEQAAIDEKASQI